jgi:hypothetical protein
VSIEVEASSKEIGCAFCRTWQPGRIQVPGGKLYCSMGCIETELFGIGHCRWCGDEIEKPYTSVESRLCSDDCSENYWAHVMGDRSASLGTGKRYLLWLQRNHPKEYRESAGIKPAPEGFCSNPYCTRGESGQPASLSHLRAGTRFCSAACKMRLQRAA